jgi:ABC-type dipeptide/oligopeptide/nickel transport system permease component
MPLPQRFGTFIAGLGLFLGGVGTFIASSIVSLQLRGQVPTLELAAILGLALGAAAGFLGTVMLLGGPSSLGNSVALAWLAVPVLGLALILLFVVGITKRLLTKEGSNPESTGRPPIGEYSTACMRWVSSRTQGGKRSR